MATRPEYRYINGEAQVTVGVQWSILVAATLCGTGILMQGTAKAGAEPQLLPLETRFD